VSFGLHQLVRPGTEEVGEHSCIAFGITFPSIQLGSIQAAWINAPIPDTAYGLPMYICRDV